MKLYRLLIPLILLSFLSVTNQINSSNTNKPPQISNEENILFYCRPSLEKELHGSLFLDSIYKETIIRTQTNETFQVKGRYQVDGDEVQILVNENPYTLLPQHIDVVIIADLELAPEEYEHEKEIKVGYLELLSKGKLSLFQRYSKENGKVESTFYSGEENAVPSYLDTRKKHLIRHLKSHRVKVYNFIQANKLDLNSTEGLRSLFDFYNGLR